MTTLTVRDVVSLMERRYPPDLASEWDAVGLAVGDPAASVTRVLFAVDAVQAVVDEAIERRCDLVVTHHPLYLRGTSTVAATTAKGRVVHDLIGHGIALYTAHTNADHARAGVSDALADLLGVHDTVPIEPLADPTVGTGRIGCLDEATTLADFARRVAAVLPDTAAGVRVLGSPERVVQTVAICGGAGDSLLGAVAATADVYVTSDLRHHPAQEHGLDGGCALIDVAHWAGEWPWLPVVAAALAGDAREAGSTVDIHVSTVCTDPWTQHLGSST